MQRVKIVTRYVKRVESYSKKKKICNLDFLYFASSQCDIYICMQHRYKSDFFHKEIWIVTLKCLEK